MSTEPDSKWPYQLLILIIEFGLICGLFITYFELVDSGFFSQSRNFILGEEGTFFLVIGVILSIGSFIVLMLCKYAGMFKVDPRLSAECQGKVSITVKILIGVLIVINVVAVLFPITNLSWFHDLLVPLVIFVLLGISDVVFFYMYRVMKARNQNEPAFSLEDRLNIIPIVYFFLLLYIWGLRVYYLTLPTWSNRTVLLLLFLATVPIFYIAYIIRRGLETNKWLLVPEELKESLHIIWARYGNLLGIAIFFILFVLLVFAF